MKKTMKKLTCALLATVSALGCATTMSACETDHPKVEMQIAFNGTTYTLEYKLYRKTAPSTVAHFLWLAGNGYYDGLCVHDYDDANARLYTGAYTASTTDATAIVYKKYFTEIAKFDNYDAFPHSVWLEKDKKTPTYTLRGEFADVVTVESGALKEGFGSLAMYYHDIENERVAGTDVYTVRQDSDELGKADYLYNNATSMFFISLTSTEKTTDEYCTFATLDEDSVEELQDLQTAINDYISNHYGDSDDDFTQERTFTAFEGDETFEDSAEVTFDVPKESIVIKKVTVTKY